MKAYVASHLKDMNRRVVYNLICERETTSKAEIAKLTGISSPTVIKIVNFLIEKGLVLELGEGESAIGRKPHLLSLNRKKLCSAAFFLEGDFLTMGIVDIGSRVVFKKSMRIEPQFDTIMEQITNDLLDTLLEESGTPLDKLAGIGITIPAIYDPAKRLIATAPLIGVHTPIRIDRAIDALSEKYGVAVVVENDTNAQSLGEYRLSAFPKPDDLVFISIGTGLGAGVILNGQLRRGARNLCGEIGYLCFLDGYTSDSHNAGWLESKISYRMLEERFGIRIDTGCAALPEPQRTSIIEYVAIPVALCVNNLTMFLDSPNIVLGGVITEMLGDQLIESINRKLERLCIGGVRVTRQTTEDTGLIGIASCTNDARILEILQEDGE